MLLYVGTLGYMALLGLPSRLQLIDDSAVQCVELLGPFVNSLILVLALRPVT